MLILQISTNFCENFFWQNDFPIFLGVTFMDSDISIANKEKRIGGGRTVIWLFYRKIGSIFLGSGLECCLCVNVNVKMAQSFEKNESPVIYRCHFTHLSRFAIVSLKFIFRVILPWPLLSKSHIQLCFEYSFGTIIIYPWACFKGNTVFRRFLRAIGTFR